MEKLPFFIHGMSITDQAAKGNVGVGQRLLTTDIDLQTASATATTANGDATLTVVSDLANFLPGAQLKGTGIPPNTRVLYASGTTVEMSKNATASGSLVTIQVGSFTDDNLHPNDFGMEKMFRNKVRAIEGAR